MTYGEIKAAINELKIAFSEDVKNIDVNIDGVKQLNENCFSVSMNTIMQSKGFCLSPTYYNVPSQKRRIIDFVENHSIETTINFLNNLIEKGKFPDGVSCNPAVIDKVAVVYKKYFI